jgi:hypothetical protein
MCPRRVCVTCGLPSRRIVGEAEYVDRRGQIGNAPVLHRGGEYSKGQRNVSWSPSRSAPTLGWSDCGCEQPIICSHCRHELPCPCGATDTAIYGDHWRPGRILDPFVGSGTTLAVASGMGRDAVGIDLDETNVDLARERVGMFLEVEGV